MRQCLKRKLKVSELRREFIKTGGILLSHTRENYQGECVHISMLINCEEDCQCFGITSLDFNIPFDNNRRKIGE